MAGKFYITTAIDYVNGPPHIGHALEKVQADTVARFERLRGKEVFFLTGTDEHGTKIVRAADAAGKIPEKFTDEMAKKFRVSLKESLNLSWDDFIRTTDRKRHWPGVELMWKKLQEAGDIYKKNYKGLYCLGHEAFITRKDLVDGKCADHKITPEVIEEENYFFRLSKYSEEIGRRIKNGEMVIAPEGRQNELLALIGAGLEDVSFSRSRKDLSWGIPVPGDDSQTIYVWCDALTNYLSAIGYGNGEDYKKWWPADVQVIGKDILRFHAAIWPGMLLSAGLPLPKKLFVHGFITAEGEKMSKTVGNVVDPVVLTQKYGTDSVRYYLLKEIPAGGDGDFSQKKFEALYNGDLANGLGNFAARVLTLGAGLGKIPKDLKPDAEISECVEKTKRAVSEKMQEFKFHEALAAIWGLIGFGDEYVNRTAPWGIKDSKEKTQTVFNLVVVLDNIAALLQPFLPETSRKITESINWGDESLTIRKSEALFPRLK